MTNYYYSSNAFARICYSYFRGPGLVNLNRANRTWNSHRNGFERYFTSGSRKDSFLIKVPIMGETVQQGDLVEWLKQPGDFIGQDEVVCVLETDKVTVDVRSPVAGVLTEHLAKAQESVRTDQPIAEIDVGKEEAACAPNDSIDGSNTKVTAETQEVDLSEPFSKNSTLINSNANHISSLDLTPLRKSSIQFRYGKRELVSTAAADDLRNAGTNAPSEYIELPPLYGRLPPMTKEEELLVRLGGAEP